MTKEWKDWTDNELANEAQTGLRGQGAVVEAMRKLREALIKQQTSTNRLSVVLIIFTVIQTILLIYQICSRK